MSASSAPPEPSECLRIAVEAAEDRKAFDIRILDLRPVCDFTDYFLICSGTNSRQLQAVAKSIEDELRDRGLRPLSVEGAPRGRWILLDFGDFLVHVLDQEGRDYYRLEDIWSDAPDVTRGYVSRAPTAAES